MPLWHCKTCHHEWEGSVYNKWCDWCYDTGYVLEERTSFEMFMEDMMDKKRDCALVIIDVQNDFCGLSGARLPVPLGDEVIPVINLLRKKFFHVTLTQDWHPNDHSSFDVNGGPWPIHCVQKSRGADFHNHLRVERSDTIVQKGTAKDADSYSGFKDDNGDPTSLDDFLKGWHLKKIYVCGLATDYCVKATVLDALELGYEVYVIEDAIRGVNAVPGDIGRAIEEMTAKGAKFITSEGV
jgi:nicotinamidase/pyrazinamidase